jgi:hypothetical protein
MRSNPPSPWGDSGSARDDTSWVDFHGRVIAGELRALETIAARGLPYLCGRLRCAFPQVDEDLLNAAAVDALIDYVRRPKSFSGAPGETLDDLMYRAAWRNAHDSLRSEARRHKREARYAKEAARQTPSRTVVDTVVRISADIRARAVETAATVVERKAAALWLDGERRTARLAEALGLSGLSMADQRLEVKRFKDRLLKRVARLLGQPRKRERRR